MKLLYLEDNPAARDYVCRGLGERGFEIHTSGDGQEGLDLLLNDRYDLCILDLGLPSLDGIEVMRRLRQARIEIPTLILSARSNIEDRVEGLNVGADDYLVKPFSFEELVARIHSLKRRTSNGEPTPESLEVSDLVMDLDRRAVTRSGQRVELTRKEYALLEYLMMNSGHTLSRKMITERIWGVEFEGYSNAINVHINHLRNKVENGHGKKLIHTVSGVGYVLEEREDEHEVDLLEMA
ncbi:MAG: response regulator transcription factor [Myxococcales bacterium]|nr:response regulator transcription factor [Myxococcales bacterium]